MTTVPERIIEGTVAGLGDLPPLLDRLKKAWLVSFTSPHTRAAYGTDLDQWFAFCADHELNPLQAVRVHGDAFARWLDAGPAPTAPRTLARKLSAISSWYGYATEEGVLATNPFAKVRRPKVERFQSETVGLTEDEARDMVAAADAAPGLTGARTAAFIRLMIELGPRVSEALAATIADLGHQRGHRTLRIVGKGQKTRVRNLPPATAASIDAYLESRASAAGIPVAELTGPLFATASGRPLDRTDAYRLVIRVAKAAGLAAKVTPHSLRHTFATVASDRGASVKQLQHALGHASSSTTDIYIHTRDQLERDPSQVVAAVIG
ncbi:tyrosine recombinase XerC [Acrocarpospora corrugata]|uniref:Tyrosine recombinase XerC n=1 Tax=Acrocarpospora corrugata TaxID=35763 RepID=A0A5M3W528_9ACTN|nr:tyrosine-type recombinase/integrase [Acrocarpospora corrugata]GES01648.1 tyrosine recombinase XerC [Acrocarpospora corrugata]